MPHPHMPMQSGHQSRSISLSGTVTGVRHAIHSHVDPWRARERRGAARQNVRSWSCSSPLPPSRTRRTGIALAIALACVAAPVAAQASTVDLATAKAFVVLAGATVTNTGPSVLNGDLGVSPGTALVGFGLARRRQRRHARHRRRRRAGADRPHDRLQRRRRAARLAGQRPDRHRPRQPDAEGRRLPLHVVGAAHRPADARRRGRPERAVRVRDRLDADDGVGELGRPPQRRQPLQRLLAGRQLRDARHHDRLPGQPDGALEHLAQQRRHGDRPRARPQRRGQPDQQRARQLALRHRSSATGVRPGTPAPGTPGAPGSPRPRGSHGALAAAGQPGDQPAAPRRPATARTSFARTPHATCTSGFRADGARPADQARRLPPRRQAHQQPAQAARYRVFVRALPGAHTVTARVTFKDATKAKTLALGYRACADAVLAPAQRPLAVHRMRRPALIPLALGAARRRRRPCRSPAQAQAPAAERRRSPSRS